MWQQSLHRIFKGAAAAGLPSAFGSIIGASLGIVMNPTDTGYYTAPFPTQTPLQANETIFMPCPRAGTMRNLYISLNSNTRTTAITVYVRKNQVNTVLLVVIPAQSGAGVFSDTADSFTVAVGDLISISFIGATSVSGSTSWRGLAFEYD